MNEIDRFEELEVIEGIYVLGGKAKGQLWEEGCVHTRKIYSVYTSDI